MARTELRAEGIRKAFDGRAVLNGVSLDVRCGDIVAIVGSSGSGKTVLLHILVGLLAPDSGRVLAAAHGTPDTPLLDIRTLDDEGMNRLRLQWAMVFQRNALFSGSVFENVALWLREHTSMTEAQVELRVRQSLAAAALNVDDVIQKNRDELSGGMAKRVAIARAIAVDPLVIFYDEPTTGLDPEVGGKIHDLIWQTHNRRRADGAVRTTVIVTHDQELLRRLSPRIIMLDQGAVCYDGPYKSFGHRGGCEAARRYRRTMPALQARASSTR